MKFEKYATKEEIARYINSKYGPKLGCVSMCMCTNCGAIYYDSICCCAAYSCGFLCEKCGFDSGLKINYVTPYKQNTCVITSMFANPLHEGHLSLLKEAKKLGDKLIVIVNNDKQVDIKGSKKFWNECFRKELLSELKCVDDVVLSIDNDGTVSQTLQRIVFNHDVITLDENGGPVHSLDNIKFIFAKGGDRKDSSCMPESELAVCEKYGIEIVYGVGGFDKKNSSSEILKGI